MENLKNWVVIDCETFGVKENEIILSLYAIRFNAFDLLNRNEHRLRDLLLAPKTEFSVSNVMSYIDNNAEGIFLKFPLLESLNAGFQLNKEVLSWWMNPSRRKLMEAQISLTGSIIENLRGLEKFLKFNDTTPLVWANSPSFDIAMLNAYFAKYGMDKVCEFYDEQDIRTIKRFFEVFDIKIEKERNMPILHDPKNDVLYESAIILNAFNVLYEFSKGRRNEEI